MRFSRVQFSWPGDDTPLLDGFSLDIQLGTVTAIVGPSGSGKSTLLRLAADLLRPQQGAVEGAARDGMAFVFQSPNLLPWRTVRDNVALPLQLRGAPAHERRERADEILARVGLAEVAGSLPRSLSGGMKMRASLARALVTEPQILLMDEPFSALDTFTRRQMHAEFLSLWQRTGLSVLFVTHDLEEAVTLSDRVVAISGRPLSIVHDQPVDLPRPRPWHDAALLERVRVLERAIEGAGA